MATITYNFTNEDNYTISDETQAEVAEGVGRCKLEDLPGLTFDEDFADNTGFTYNSNNTEFVGGVVRQIDKRPTDATFYATFDVNTNGNWGDGDLNSTEIGTIDVSGGCANMLDYGNNWFWYNAAGNADSQQVGTVEFKLKPNYSGAPASVQHFTYIYDTTGSNKNLIRIFHSPGAGVLSFQIYDSNSTIKVSIAGTWVPVAGQEYVFSFNWDGDAGESRAFIDGVQFLGTNPTTFVRDSNINIWRVGKANSTAGITTNFSFCDLIYYSTVQRTTNYTPDFSQLTSTTYLGDKIELPAFSYSGVGSIQQYTSFATTDSGNPRYVINDMYWDGDEWTTSDGSWDQANVASIIDTNISTLGVLDDVYVDLITNDGNSLMQADTLCLCYTGQIYVTSDPTITPNTLFYASDILTFTATEEKTGSDEIKYTISVNGVQKYWDGLDWVNSNGTYAQSSTLTEISTNITSLTLTRNTIIINVFLHSDDGSTTPAIDNISITFDAALQDPSRLPTLVDLNGFIYDMNGPCTGQTIKIRPYQKGYQNPNDGLGGGVFQKYGFETVAITDSDGFFSAAVYLQPDNEFIEIKIGRQSYYTQLPDEVSVDFNTLTLTVVE